MSESGKAELHFRFRRLTEAVYEGEADYCTDVGVDATLYQGDRTGWVKLVVDQIRKHPDARPVFLLPPRDGNMEYRYALSARTTERLVSGELSARDILL